MKRILDTIDSPAHLKKLNAAQLERLAGEMRQEIIETVALRGGHLAPNLGTVELTLALHVAFDAPHDKLVWDIGHQAYPHKLVTGRRDRFHTIKQLGGLSGYLRRDESPYDAFGASHASTSISAALGMATARDLQGEKYQGRGDHRRRRPDRRDGARSHQQRWGDAKRSHRHPQRQRQEYFGQRRRAAHLPGQGPRR